MTAPFDNGFDALPRDLREAMIDHVRDLAESGYSSWTNCTHGQAEAFLRMVPARHLHIWIDAVKKSA